MKSQANACYVHPGEVRNAGEHGAAVGDRLGPVDRLAVNGESNVAHDGKVEAGGRDDNVGLEGLA